jgi:membrane dipeptidase
VGDSLEYLTYLKDKGVIYITLCHVKSNQISDSNFDTDIKWNGLSPFGKEMIKEMNKLGIMVDVSHSTDSAVFQALEISKAPIIASHSSCRHFTPGFERNLSDTLIKSIALKGGVVMLNFASWMLNEECFRNWTYLAYKWQDSTGIYLDSKKGTEFIEEYGKEHKLTADVKSLVDHVDHIVKIAGIDYVGLGSDFDGLAQQALPFDLQDVSCYPLIVAELLSRGYKNGDIKKILSGNFLRVWNEVIDLAEYKNN